MSSFAGLDSAHLPERRLYEAWILQTVATRQGLSCFQVNHLCFRSLPSRAGREQIHRRMHTAGGMLHRVLLDICRTGFCPVRQLSLGILCPGTEKGVTPLALCVRFFVISGQRIRGKSVHVNGDERSLFRCAAAGENGGGQLLRPDRSWTERFS